MFQLKKGQEAFTAVEGPLAGRTFAPGKLYPEVPPVEAKRFVETTVRATAAVKPAKAESRRAAVSGPAPSEKGEVKK